MDLATNAESLAKGVYDAEGRDYFTNKLSMAVNNWRFHLEKELKGPSERSRPQRGEHDPGLIGPW